MSEHDHTTDTKNEGEGNRTAARQYNKHAEEFVASGEVEAAAREAEDALDGPEGEQLRAAEAEGKAKQADKVKAERER